MTEPNGTGGLPGANGTKRNIRAELKKRRVIEKEVGVPLWLEHDGLEARVRMLNLLESSSLIGLPAQVQMLLLRGFNATQDAALPPPGERTLEDMLRVMTTEESSVNELCLVGFIWPVLTRNKADADAANDPDTVWVEELSLYSRKKYASLVMGQDAAEMSRVLDFLRRQVARLDDPGARQGSGEAPSLLHVAGYGGGGVLPEGTPGG